MAKNVNVVNVEDPIAINRLKNQFKEIDGYAQNFTTRWSRFDRQFGNQDSRRDLDDEYGYPRTEEITLNDYWIRYFRDPVAKQVVDILPKFCWQKQPEVYETKDLDNDTEFEEAFKALNSNLRGNDFSQNTSGNILWEYLFRLDKISGIGRYGVLLIGVGGEEGKDLSQPLELNNSGKVTRELIYLKAFPESLAKIVEYEQNASDFRYGLPTYYELVFGDASIESQVSSSKTERVHWSRVLHVTDEVISNEILHTPRMLTVWNRFLDLDKLYGGSAEMYFKGALPGISFETHPQLGGDVEIDLSALKDMTEYYQNGLQRMLATVGMSANSLAPQVVDPTPQINIQIEAICIVKDCPKRIFMGSERGELASSQDSRHWNDIIVSRRENSLTPNIIIPLVNKFIQLGILPRPAEENGFTIHWPEIQTLNPLEKADQALKITQAIITYVGGDGDMLMPIPKFLTEVLGIAQSKAEEILEFLEEEGLDEVLKVKALGSIADPEADLDRKIRLEQAKGQPASKGFTK